MNEEGEIAAVPVAILDRRMGRVGHKAVVYLLVQWSTGTREDATWSHTLKWKRSFPIWILQLEDKLYFVGGRMIRSEKKSRAYHALH